MIAANLRQWAEGLDPSMAAFAMQIATAAPLCMELLRMVDGEGLPTWVPDPPSVSVWLPLYRDHKRIRHVFSFFFTPAILHDPNQQFVLDAWLRDAGKSRWRTPEQRELILSQLSPEKRAFIERNIRETSEALMRIVWEELEHEIEGDEIEGPVWDCVREAVHMPEFQFFLRVWFPCWLLYGQSAKSLFARCRRGDLDALEQLIPLDRRILAEHRIIDLLAPSSDPKKMAHQKCIIESLSKPLKRTTVRQVKIVLAALISILFQAVQKPLTAPKIMALFNAVAKDFGQGPTDRDLQDDPGVFYQAIYRARKFWLIVPDPDKKNM